MALGGANENDRRSIVLACLRLAAEGWNGSPGPGQRVAVEPRYRELLEYNTYIEKNMSKEHFYH